MSISDVMISFVAKYARSSAGIAASAAPPAAPAAIISAITRVTVRYEPDGLVLPFALVGYATDYANGVHDEPTLRRLLTAYRRTLDSDRRMLAARYRYVHEAQRSDGNVRFIRATLDILVHVTGGSNE